MGITLRNSSTIGKSIFIDTSNPTITIKLPNALKSGTLYNFKVNNDKYLFGSSSSNSGVWEYTRSTDTFNQLYSESSSWSNFLKIDDNRALVASGNLSGVWLYNAVDSSFTKITSNLGYSIISADLKNNRKLVTSWASGRVCIFDEQTNTMSDNIISVSANIIKKINNDRYILTYSSGSISSNYGVAVYDDNTGTGSKLYTEGNGWTNITAINNNAIISSTNNSFRGVLLYNSADNTITKIYDPSSWINLSYRHVFGNICLLSNSSSTGGIWVYDDDLGTFTKPYASGYWSYFYDISDTKCLIAGSGGLLVYNNTDKTFTKLTDGANFNIFIKISDTKVLITSSVNWAIYLYDSTTDSFTKKWSDSYSRSRYAIIGENCLIGGNGSTSSSGGNGVVLYNNTTETITQLLSGNNYRCNNFKVVGNKCIITGDGGTNSFGGIALYDNTTQSLSIKISSAPGLDKFTEDSTGCLIEASDISKNKYIYHYNSSDDSVTIYGCKL